DHRASEVGAVEDGAAESAVTGLRPFAGPQSYVESAEVALTVGIAAANLGERPDALTVVHAGILAPPSKPLIALLGWPLPNKCHQHSSSAGQRRFSGSGQRGCW